jgi:hypothetical protein
MTLPPRVKHLRTLLIVCGILVFIWSSAEDNRVLPAVLLGLFCSVSLMLWWMSGWYGNKTLSPRNVLLVAALFGGGIGLNTSLITTLLMFLKNVRHAHLFPDYPLPLMAAVVELAPLWGAAGILFGFGIFALWWALFKIEDFVPDTREGG